MAFRTEKRADELFIDVGFVSTGWLAVVTFIFVAFALFGWQEIGVLRTAASAANEAKNSANVSNQEAQQAKRDALAASENLKDLEKEARATAKRIEAVDQEVARALKDLPGRSAFGPSIGSRGRPPKTASNRIVAILGSVVEREKDWRISDRFGQHA